MRILRTVICLLLLSVPILGTIIDSHLENYKLAHNKEKPYPTLSLKQGFFSISNAYVFQKKWVDFLEKESSIIGYKAGLTSAQAQKKFNTNYPIFGVLLPEKTYQNFDIIPMDNAHDLHIEPELGFRLKQAITEPIESLYILKNLISEVVAVAELPDIRLQPKNGDIHLIDIIMCNAASRTIVVGSPLPKKIIDEIPVTIRHNDTVLHTETSGVLMKGQLNALQWLINTAIDQGYTIDKDMLLITGSIGPMVPAKKGRYVIDYGDHSSLLFDLK